MPEIKNLYEKIKKPYPINVSDEMYQKFTETYGPGYACPDREKINNNLRWNCPNEVLRLKYAPFTPIDSYFEQSWSYLMTYLLPAIEENHQSLTHLRFSKSKELPTHFTMMGKVNTMQSILQLLDAWIDSNGADRMQFMKSAKWRVEELNEKLKPFFIVREKNLTKREKHLYFKIHWDSFETAFQNLRLHFYMGLENLWEYGIQLFLNLRDFPKHSYVVEDAPKNPQGRTLKCDICKKLTPIDEIKTIGYNADFTNYCPKCDAERLADSHLKYCDGCKREFPEHIFKKGQEFNFCPECTNNDLKNGHCAACGKIYPLKDLHPYMDGQNYCMPCYTTVTKLRICYQCGKTILLKDTWTTNKNPEKEMRTFCKDCFKPTITEVAQNIYGNFCPHNYSLFTNGKMGYYCDHDQGLLNVEYPKETHPQQASNISPCSIDGICLECDVFKKEHIPLPIIPPSDELIAESSTPPKVCRYMIEVDGVKKCNFRVFMEEITEPETIPQPELCNDDTCGWIYDIKEINEDVH